jgi:hypothetical protein
MDLFGSENEDHSKIMKQLTSHDFYNISDKQDPRTEDIEHFLTNLNVQIFNVLH